MQTDYIWIVVSLAIIAIAVTMGSINQLINRIKKLEDEVEELKLSIPKQAQRESSGQLRH